jgi:hypothetical protein
MDTHNLDTEEIEARLERGTDEKRVPVFTSVIMAEWAGLPGSD